LLDSSGQLKLTDFGISKDLGKTYAITNTFVGTLVYMSPERMSSKNYSYSADIWALGIILFEMAMGKHPYVKYVNQMGIRFRDKQTYIELIQTIRQQPSPLLTGNCWSHEIRDFLRLCLEKEDTKRGDAESLLVPPSTL
jgi:mitogen-activated protein kinase kinase 1